MILSLRELLRMSSDRKSEPLQQKCRDLLGNDLYAALFSPSDTAATLSKIRSGYPVMNARFKNVVQLLAGCEDVEGYLEPVRRWWEKHPAADPDGLRTLVEADEEYRIFTSRTEGFALRAWVSASFSLFPGAWQSELMTVLTLLSITRGEWDTLLSSIRLKPIPAGEDSAVVSTCRSKKRAGLAFYRQNRFQEAIACFEDAFLPTEADKDERAWNSDLHFWLGAVWLKRWERNKEALSLSNALDELDKACLLGSAEGRLELARLCLGENAREICRLRPAWDHRHGLTLCRELTASPVSDPIRGEAFWLLYQDCVSRDHPHPHDDERAKQYLESAHRCGYPPEALRLYRSKFPAALVLPPLRSGDRGEGLCIFNADNRYAALLKRTMPTGWASETTDTPAFLHAAQAHKRKYMLLSDDPDRNVGDMLQILQAVLDNGSGGDTEVFIRGDANRLAPVVDSALHHMGSAWIPVHILDYDKRNAQRLLGCHPLLYPLDQSDKADQTLHFLIIGSGRCCQWLAREALWMLTMRDERIKTRITLVGPHAEEDLEMLHFLCPGLRRERLVQTDFIRTELDACNCTVSYLRLMEILSAAVCADEALYLAVDVGGDQENLDMAIRLREESIRAQSWKSAGRPRLPVIAFRCWDAALAELGKSTVVVNEAGGLGWYNNYGLIPFGTESLYTWDALTNDVLEEISRRCHLAYSGVSPALWEAPDASRTPEEVRQDYFTRTYNRDSSMATALSLPYLLLQSRWPGVASLRPEDWDIRDGETFYSAENRLAFVKKLHGAVKAEGAAEPWGETRQLAEWEHARWCSYMISRGWVSAAPEEAEAYCRAGNPRQQLYIGRMHPCITPYSKLEALEKHLRATVGLDKNFRKSCLQSVMCVEEILEA